MPNHSAVRDSFDPKLMRKTLMAYFFVFAGLVLCVMILFGANYRFIFLVLPAALLGWLAGWFIDKLRSAARYGS